MKWTWTRWRLDREHAIHARCDTDLRTIGPRLALVRRVRVLRRKTLGLAAPRPASLEVTLRLATPDDDTDVARLAVLDSAEMPSRPLLLAEVAGELWVAVSLTDFRVIADPFRPSGELAFIAVQRARQLRAPAARAASGRLAGWLSARVRASV